MAFAPPKHEHVALARLLPGKYRSLKCQAATTLLSEINNPSSKVGSDRISMLRVVCQTEKRQLYEKK
jgi:hypothetical protein